jgi:glycosyltransferase involved in cell wall biosynthesis
MPPVGEARGASPTVSVCMITYNHERYIAQAVESVMAQSVAFDVELVIGDDASTDRTSSILLDLQSRYGRRIRHLRRPSNIGMMANYVDVLTKCSGDYIATLEGDDFWSDPCKLERQVALLESNPALSGCFGRALVVSDDDARSGRYIPSDDPTRRVVTLDTLLQKNCISTCTMVYRNFLREVDLSPFLFLRQGDWPLHIHAAIRGPIAYMNDVVACYRMHSGGVWTSAAEAEKAAWSAQASRYVVSVVPARSLRLAKACAARKAYQAARSFLVAGDSQQAHVWSRRALGWLGCQILVANKGLACRAAYMLVMSSVRQSKVTAETSRRV